VLGIDGPSAFKAQRRLFVFKMLRSSLIAIGSAAGPATVPALPSAVSSACGSLAAEEAKDWPTTGHGSALVGLPAFPRNLLPLRQMPPRTPFLFNGQFGVC
jgi:hypothetical protein